MDVLVTASARFSLTSDGQLWTSNASLGYEFWTRYLEAFDRVRLLVRAKPVDRPPGPAFAVSGPNIEPIPLPYFAGVGQFLRRRSTMRRAVREALKIPGAIILRLPSVTGELVWSIRDVTRAYGVEIVGDPWDVFAPGASRHPLRPILRWRQSRQLRRQVSQAIGAAFVTQSTLQRRYPPAAGAVTAAYSSVVIDQQDIAAMPRQWNSSSCAHTVVTVGSLDQPYKGVDTLIRAVAIAQTLPALRLIVVGDGRLRRELEELAAALCIAERVHFVGKVASSAEVRRYLDQADLFVLASRTEGLPRAMIEAMARGLPCIGTGVGGIPELLPESCLVEPNQPQQLANRMEMLLSSPWKMTQFSTANLRIAADFDAELLTARRNDFYREIRRLSAETRRPSRYGLTAASSNFGKMPGKMPGKIDRKIS